MPGQISHAVLSYNSKYDEIYTVHASFPELAKNRKFTGASEALVYQQATDQVRVWTELWERQCSAQKRAHSREEKQQLASQRSRDAAAALEALESTLHDVLKTNPAIDWRRVENRRAFAIPKPEAPAAPGKPVPIAILSAPSPSHANYQPQFNVTDRLMPARRDHKIAEAKARFDTDTQAWTAYREQQVTRQALQSKAYEEHCSRLQASFQQSLQVWEQKKQVYADEQRQNSEAVQQRKSVYMSHDKEAIREYCGMVLSQSIYPDFFPEEWELDYNPDTQMLLVDYTLPSPDDLPALSEVSYIASKDEFREKHTSEAQRARTYDALIYQTALRTLYELFYADTAKAIAAIVLNGFVDSTDRATGKQARSCVISIQVKQADFRELDLAKVDPKACFKQLKGVGSSKLHSVTPVAPIQQMRREDGRFVAEYAVAHQIDEGYNLAAMDWEDFEHLIREIFEQEFSSNGGEVKVTRASRDGGVDAVVFDPDPIRGGKIVIQAKRYSNTVGVAAVRDLYGTLMNEGANKGILVTTSDYGPDAYEFAAGKPLTLMNGANLLHLLEKHGHKAKIDLQEARRLAMQQQVR